MLLRTLVALGLAASVYAHAQLLDVQPALSGLAALPGAVGVLVTHNDLPAAEIHADAPLGVASGFKLAVLKLLCDDIREGKRRWGDLVELRSHHKSIPSGVLQNWPTGSRITLETLARLMISRSDNTATDVLMGVVGRARLEALSPRNRPFLTTRELFALKDRRNADLLGRYLASPLEARVGMLPAVLARPKPRGAYIPRRPQLGVEWYFTARELCGLMAELRGLWFMGLNPGVARPLEWKSVAYKGGNEAGVVSMTTYLESAAGQRYCVSAVWNNARGVSNARFAARYRELLDALREPLFAEDSQGEGKKPG